MNRPKEKIKKETLILSVLIDEFPCSLGVLQEKIRQDPEFNLEDVRVQWHHYDDRIDFRHITEIDNPNYETELAAYERHVRDQIEEKIAYKMKAKENLLQKIDVIEREIDEMRNR